MKTLPIEYWENAYPHLPSYYQRYWVQRCLELLDTDTSYLSGLPLTNSAALVQELVNTPPNVPGSDRFGSNARTLHFLLNELQAWLVADDVMRRFVTFMGSQDELWRQLQFVVREGTRLSSMLFTPEGFPISSAEGMTRRNFVLWLQDQGIAGGFHTGIMRRIADEIENSREVWLECHAIALSELLELPVKWNAELMERTLENATQSWLYELVVRGQYNSIHVSELLTSAFLGSYGLSFSDLLKDLLGTLRANRTEYVAFMRLQVRKELGRIGQVGSVKFSTDCQEGSEIVSELIRIHTITPIEARQASDFFYQGQDNPRFVFASASAIAENVGAAARSCLEQLDVTLRQARFEFERTKLSIDNVIYVYNSSRSKLTRYTRRQAQAEQYLSLGHPIRFERLVHRIDQLRLVPQKWVTESIRTQITDLALEWHRHAVEGSPPEIRFMNHWIELEQLFKTASAEELTSLSPGDAVVQALAHALADMEESRALRDLWGDMERCDVLGPKPYRVRHTGRVRYTHYYFAELSDPSHKGRQNPYRRLKGQPIDIEILDSNRNQRLKGYRVPPGYEVFVKDNDKIMAGDWLAGPRLVVQPWEQPKPRFGIFSYLSPDQDTRPSCLRGLFECSNPRPINTFYLLSCWPIVGSWLRHAHPKEFSEAVLQKVVELRIEDVHSYEEVDRLARDLSFELEVDIGVMDLLKNYSHLDSKLGMYGWPSRTGLRVRLSRAYRKLEELADGDRLTLLVCLDSAGYHLKKSGRTPDSVWFELFRGCVPNYKALIDVMNSSVDALAMGLPDQPLLRSRLYQVSRDLELQCKEDRVRRYIWSLDRMRRTRNAIVHTGVVPDTIPFLARRIYEYSKTYIRQVIKALTSSSSEDEALKEALHL